MFVLSFLLSSSALASELKLQPYFPSPFPGLPFALAPQCFLNGVGSDGGWHGVLATPAWKSMVSELTSRW